MIKKGFICTAYFKGKDGMGTCDTKCQWWNNGCVMAKGSKKWDGKNSSPTNTGEVAPL